jgi:beta-apo-4'-carotenal oxygenase
VTASANATIAAKRTAWGKLHNAGQICIAPNYVLVHPSQEQAFVQGFIQAISTYLPNGAKGSPDMASIIDGRSFERVKGLLQTTKGNILCGGGVDEHTRFIEPTLVKVSDVGDTLMNEEIFGPVLAMLVVDNVDEMLNIARGIGETPLAMYVFSSEKEEQEKCKCLALVRNFGVERERADFY